MTRAKVEWNSDEFFADLQDAIQDGLEDVGVSLADAYGDVLNRRASNKSNGGIPAPPGYPPAKDTGTLARSISYQMRLGSVSVGVSRNSPANQYALPLEYGTRNMAARPWLRPTLKKFRRKINRIFTRRVRSQMREWLD